MQRRKRNNPQEERQKNGMQRLRDNPRRMSTEGVPTEDTWRI